VVVLSACVKLTHIACSLHPCASSLQDAQGTPREEGVYQTLTHARPLPPLDTRAARLGVLVMVVATPHGCLRVAVLALRQRALWLRGRAITERFAMAARGVIACVVIAAQSSLLTRSCTRSLASSSQVVIILSGRYAGKKAVVLKTFDDGYVLLLHLRLPAKRGARCPPVARMK
jgi:hypothetical protein